MASTGVTAGEQVLIGLMVLILGVGCMVIVWAFWGGKREH